MNKQFDARRYRYIQVLHSYVTALEHGDLNIVAAMLQEAEHDAVLERMLLELHAASSETAQAIHPADVLPLQQLLQMYLPKREETARQLSTPDHDAPFLLEQQQAAKSTQYDTNIVIDDLPLEDGRQGTFVTKKKRYRRLSTFLQSLAAVLVIAALLGSFLALFIAHRPEAGSPGGPAGIWHVTPTMNPGSVNNTLLGVAAVSANDAWAVGSFSNNTTYDRYRALIEHWNGKWWSVIAGPHPGKAEDMLNGIVAISPADAWAIGTYTHSAGGNTYRTLIEHWNGKLWSVVPSPNEGSSSNFLGAITAVSANDIWAVGYSLTSDNAQIQTTLIEHWNGSRWSIVKSPSPGSARNELRGVSAVSANDIWAVGLSSNGNSATLAQTLIEHWNGSQWSILPDPHVGSSDNYLNDVVAVSANDIWADGGSADSVTSNLGQTLIEHWNGQQWSVVKSPSIEHKGNLLGTISAISASNIWVVGGSFNDTSSNTGQSQSLTLHWNGSQWDIVKSPNPGSNFSLLSGAAKIPESTKIWTVGYYSNDSQNGLRTLAAIYS